MVVKTVSQWWMIQCTRDGGNDNDSSIRNSSIHSFIVQKTRFLKGKKDEKDTIS